jgi:hypothetical protein
MTQSTHWIPRTRSRRRPQGIRHVLVCLLAVTALTAALAPTTRADTRDERQAADRARASAYAYAFQNPALSPDARVRDVISRLTLDEKVGLLHQFSAAVIRLGIPQFRTGTEGLHGVS